VSDPDLMRVLARQAKEEEDAESSDRAKAIRDAMPPLDDARRRQMADAAIRELSSPEQPAAESTRGRFRTRRWMTRQKMIAGIGASAAAAIIIAVSVTGRREAIAPDYELTISRGVRDDRGASVGSTIPTYEPETQFELTLRPTQPMTSPIALRGLVERDGHVVRWGARPELAESGAIHVAGPAGEILPAEPGEWTLILILGPRDEIDAIAQGLEAGRNETERASGVRVFREKLRMRARAQTP
jgi:hypothetical protein